MERGARLGPYEIVDKIGAGGMGEVYEAEDTRLGRRIALKTLPAELADDPTRRARFEQEARAAAALDHPAIVTVHSIEEADGVPFITFRLVHGQTLAEFIPADGLDVARMLELAEPLVDAIATAHAGGVIHRDLKPANIVVDGAGRPNILDFGIAAWARGEAARVDPESDPADTRTRLDPESSPADAATRLTADGAVLGTVAYMAPEQATGQATDHRTDLYSLGVVLYQMLTGRLPFAAASPAEMLVALLRDDPVPLSDVRADLPRELTTLVERCLRKEPERRPRSATEVAEVLARVRASVEPLGLAPGAIAPRLRATAPWLIGAAVVATFVVWLFAGSDPRVVMADTRPLTREQGLELDPAISPDGNVLAYAAGPRGATRIHVRQIGGSGRALVVSDAVPGGHRGPRWSPDGNRLAFVAARGGVSELYSVPALGGAVRRHASLEGTPVATVDWSPDGAALAYSGNSAIHLLEVETGSARQIAEAYLPHTLAWSPDGSLLAYVSGNPYSVHGAADLGNRAPTSIWTVDAEEGRLERITADEHLDLGPSWSPDGRHLYFLSDRGGRGDLYRVGVDEAGAAVGTAVAITTGLGAHTLAVSPDGDAVVYSTLEARSNIWSLPIPSAGTAESSPARVTEGNQQIETSSVSPDGRWLAFDSDRAGKFDIYRMPLAGGPVEQITDDPGDDFHPKWSPDGQWLAFHSFRAGTRDIWIVPAAGGVAQQVTAEASHERGPRWSPHGDEILFFGDPTGRQELYVTSREGEGWASPRRITEGGGIHPTWSPDGTMIGYVVGSPRHPRSNQRYEIRLMSAAGDAIATLVRAPDPVGPVPETLAWSADSRTVYYTTIDGDGAASIWSVAAAGGDPRELVRFDDPERRPNRHEFTAADGRFYFTLAEHEADLWVARLGEER